MELRLIKDEYLSYLTDIRNYSSLTVKNYDSDLRIFCDFCEQHSNLLLLSDVNRDHVQEFVTFTKKVLHNSPYATARKLRCIKSFMRYAMSRDYIALNPAQGISEPKISRRLPVYLNPKEANKLLNAVDGKFKERDFAIISIFLFCGLRVSEVSGLNLDSLDHENKTMQVIGKGDKERLIPLVPPVYNSIQRYLRARPATKSKALFLSYRKSRLSVRGIQKIIKDYTESLGLQKNVTPHKLRHTCATLLYSEGSLLELKQLLGHESVATTQIYAHTNSEQTRKLAESNPLLKIINTMEENMEDLDD